MVAARSALRGSFTEGGGGGRGGGGEGAMEEGGTDGGGEGEVVVGRDGGEGGDFSTQWAVSSHSPQADRQR